MKQVEDFMSAEADRFCQLPQGEICYRVFGPEQGSPLFLIGGLGVQLIYWPNRLISQLVEAGHRVVVFDNRDIGKSFRHSARPPRMKNHILRKPMADGYSLSDMAGDVVGLMDHLSVSSAHVVGMSMGGMIAQTLAAEHAHRVLSLTSIFSNTGNPKYGQPSLKGKVRLLKKRPRTREEDNQRYLDMIRFIAEEQYMPSEESVRAYAGMAWDRGNGPRAGAGIGRQINAVYASGNREKALANIKAPTLVIHGAKDPLVNPNGGKATARAIPGASFITIAGMGHYISDAVSPMLADLVIGHTRRAAASVINQ